jgi:hypothetical protein
VNNCAPIVQNAQAPRDPRRGNRKHLPENGFRIPLPRSPVQPVRMTDAGIPAAHIVLLLCARPLPDASVDAALGEAIARGVEWDALLALAEANRMLPLAHRALAGRADVPETVRSRLRIVFAENGRQALALAAELRRLVAALQGAGVRALAYKGPALAMRAYGHLALRTYSDLDLLVAPDDVPAAARVLSAAGYQSAHRLTPAQDAAFRRTDGDYPYHHPRTAVLVELHCHVSSLRFGVPLATERLIARARPVPIGGGGVLAPADDDLFLALCVHGAKHRWARLEWLAAAAALAVRAALDLDALLVRAAEVGARRTVLLALVLMRDALALPLSPAADRAASADPVLPALAAEARALWFAADPHRSADAGDSTDSATPALTHSRTHALNETAANLRFNYRLREGAADRARFAARWLFTPSPEDWAWARLPDALSPLYRALRPLRLGVRYGLRRGG